MLEAEEKEIAKNGSRNKKIEKLENRKNVNRWGRQKLSFKEDSDLAFAKRQMKVECPNCKHLIGFYAFETKDKKICPYCNKYVFKNKRIEFEYKMKQLLK